VMDNASYHSAILNKAPSKNSRKFEIVDWLKKKNITVDPTETRAELLQHVQLLKTHNMNWTKSLMNGVTRLYDCHHTIANIIP
jgi:hypothetical protein